MKKVFNFLTALLILLINLLFLTGCNSNVEQPTEVLPESIYISKKPSKLVYKVGEEFDSTRMVVKARFANGKTEILTDYEIEGFDSSKAVDSQFLFVKYIKEDKTYRARLAISIVGVNRINLISLPDKTEYLEGDSFDSTGLVVEAIYGDDSSKILNDYTTNFNDVVQSAGNEKLVKIIYGEIYSTFCITVNHDWNDGIVTIAPTCKQTGVKTFTCKHDGCGETRAEVVDATGSHMEDWGTITDATCVTDGVIVYKCSVCDEILRRVPTKQALGHNWNEGKIIREPTCKTKGEKKYSCQRIGCGSSKTEELEITGIHKWTAKIDEEGDYILTTCSSCFRVETVNLYSRPLDSDGKKASSDLEYVYFGVFPQTELPKTRPSETSSVTVDKSISVKMGGHTYYRGSDGNYYYLAITNYGGSYFLLEPIKWKVITKNYRSTNKCLLLAEKNLIAGIPYYVSKGTRTIGGKTIYANNYKYSTIRAYLNGKYENDDNQTSSYKGIGFLQTAFTEKAQSKISTTTVRNDASSTTDAKHNLEPADGSLNCYNNMHGSHPDEIICSDTKDKIFLLSVSEVTSNSYGFEDYDCPSHTRDFYKTDYAEFLTNSRRSFWLRSPMYSHDHVMYVDDYGYAKKASYVCTGDPQYGYIPAEMGTVPALTIYF